MPEALPLEKLNDFMKTVPPFHLHGNGSHGAWRCIFLRNRHLLLLETGYQVGGCLHCHLWNTRDIVWWMGGSCEETPVIRHGYDGVDPCFWLLGHLFCRQPRNTATLPEDP